MTTETSEVDRDIERELSEQVGASPPDLIVAMTIWGEARGAPVDGKRAVAAVIRNRAAIISRNTGYPMLLSASQVCLAPGQFSCWVNGKFVQTELDDSLAWVDCVAAAKEIFLDSYDPLIVATHYYAQSPATRPGWTDGMEYVCKVGSYLFYFDPSWRG